MKLKYIIGILVLLLLMAGTASAETFSINKTNIAVPTGSVNIDVTYNADAHTITFQDRSTGLTNPRITWVAYNLNVNKDQIKGYNSTVQNVIVSGEIITDWTDKKEFGAKGEFGDLLRVYAVKNPKPDYRFTKVVVDLPSSFDGNIEPNTEGYQVGVHFVCDQFSCFVAGPTPKEPEEPDVPIPEFSTVALPFAAILGLMFIFGRRKQE